MSQDEDLTRRLLAPRERSRQPAVPAAPVPGPARWRWGAMLTLSAMVAASGVWWWQAGHETTAPAVLPAAPMHAPVPTPLPAAVTVPATTADMRSAPVAAVASPRLASVSDLLQAPAAPRLRWSRFQGNPAIVVIEYPDLRQQGLAMNRLAAMFEKRAARRDRVLSEPELSALLRRSGDNVESFYQGHDYPADKLARFFSLAAAQRIELNAQEMQLQSVLIDAELMRRSDAGIYHAEGEQAAVSFTAVQPDDPGTAPDEAVDRTRREAVLRHELSHGEFFTNPAYRAHSIRFWRSVLTEGERRMFRSHLKRLDYNPVDDELMANETQALLMHTPDSRAFNASNLGISEAALAQLRIRFRAGEPANGLGASAR